MAGKFSNRPTIYNGVRYPSKTEADFAATLDIRVRARDIKGWTRQLTFPLYNAEGEIFTRFTIDFCVEHLDGSLEYVEVKYSHDAVSRDFKFRWELFVMQHGPAIREKGGSYRIDYKYDKNMKSTSRKSKRSRKKVIYLK